MIKSFSKAYLLSFFVLPGAGHFFINKKIMGGVLAVLSAIAMLVFLVNAFSIVVGLINEINPVNVSVVEIRAMIINALDSQSGVYFVYSWRIFWLVWLLALLDVARVHYLQKRKSHK